MIWYFEVIKYVLKKFAKLGGGRVDEVVNQI